MGANVDLRPLADVTLKVISLLIATWAHIQGINGATKGETSHKNVLQKINMWQD